MQRFVDIYKKKRNGLVHISKWDDPFEGFLFKQPVVDTKRNQNISISSVYDSFYGQCWSLNNEESDATWRIYSASGKDGVRAQTTIRKLWNSFYNPDYPLAITSFFCGKVDYHSESEIRDHYSNRFSCQDLMRDVDGKICVDTILTKRNEFRHENEFRLIHYNHESSLLQNGVYEYDMEPNDIFERVVFDPRMTNSDYAKFQGELGRNGCLLPIDRSTLYSIPNLQLKWEQ